MGCCHAEAGDVGEEAKVDDPIIDRGAQHATGRSTWSAASAASGLVLAASGCTWTTPESRPWAEPFKRV
eukprot:scaffold58142_cov78-Phaeocystis_antarctica.AAC.1